MELDVNAGRARTGYLSVLFQLNILPEKIRDIVTELASPVLKFLLDFLCNLAVLVLVKFVEGLNNRREFPVISSHECIQVSSSVFPPKVECRISGTFQDEVH